ncbi:hypothetical protein CL614_10010 [archaeon]|nr:hypothetical protein [archaeon]|tara:strand:+ start:690 stop:1559 length:870 start_codon:yes stop_codon:yes gene_type:complete
MKVKLHHTLNYNTEEAIALNSEPKYWEYFQDDNSPIHIFYDTLLPLAKTIKCKKKIAIIHETPAIYEHADINSNYKIFNPHRYLKQNPELFDLVLSPYSYIKEIVGEEKWLWHPTTDTFLKEEDFGFYEKSRLLSIIASHKTWTVGQRLRHEIIKQFGTEMDIYGNGYNTILNDIGYGSKVQALGPYRFTIAVSNTNEDDYFSEIITDACLVGTIPIFWGTSNIGKYMNEEGILSFETLDDLGIILKSLSKELYNSKIKAVEDNMNRAKSFKSGLDWEYLNYQKEVFSI